MKPQRYPATIIKTGAVLYSATAWADDTGKGHIDIDEWHVRSIQKRAISKYSETKSTVISLVEKKNTLPGTGISGCRTSQRFTVGSSLKITRYRRGYIQPLFRR